MAEPNSHLEYLQVMYNHLQKVLDQFQLALQNAFLSLEHPSEPQLSIDEFLDLYDSDSLSEGWTVIEEYSEEDYGHYNYKLPE
jgi:hypothetical protein